MIKAARISGGFYIYSGDWNVDVAGDAKALSSSGMAC
jgi:hypothetical protein